MAVDGEVLATGDGAGGQGRLQDRTANRWRGGRDRGWDTQNDTDVTTALPGGVLGVPPYSYTERIQ